MKWLPVVIGLVILAVLTVTTFQLRQRVDLPQLSFGRAHFLSPVPTPSPTPIPAAYAKIPGTNLQYDSSDVLAAEAVKLINAAGQLDHQFFDAYANLQAKDRLDNDNGSDILTRAQADARYVTIETTSGGTTSGTTVTTQSAMQINDLTDVDAVGPSANQILKYNADAGKWSLGNDDNTTYGAGSGLTLTDSNNFEFGGDLAEDVTIGLSTYDWLFTGTGNVGIGTTAPSYKLDVNGDIQIASGSELYSFGSATLGNRTYTGEDYVTDGQTFTASIQALDDAIAGVVGGTSGVWTRTGTVLHQNTLTDDLALGGTTSSSPLFFDTSASSLTLNPYGVSTGNTGELRLTELVANGSNYTGFKSSDNLSDNVIYTLPTADASTANQVLASDSAGNLSWIDVSAGSGGIGGGGTDNYLARWDGTADLQTSSIYVTDAGNIGIGTTAPSFLLDIQGSTGTQQIKSTAGYTYVYSQYNNTGGDFIVGRESSSGGALTLGSAPYYGVLNVKGNYGLHLATNNNVRATITATGNLGIGTTSPSFLLDVNGTGRFTGALQLDTVSSVANNNQVLTVDSGVVKYIDTTNWDTDNTDDASISSLTSGYLPYYNGTNLANSVTYTDGTNVGIGTTNPLTKLEVSTNITTGNREVARFTNLGSTSDTYLDISVGTPGYYDDYILFLRSGTPVLSFTNSNDVHSYQNFKLSGTDLTFGSTSHGYNFYRPYTSGGEGVISANTSLKFNNAGSTSMTITSGNVGIGTTAPAQSLDIIGKIRFRNSGDAGGVVLRELASGTALEVTNVSDSAYQPVLAGSFSAEDGSLSSPGFNFGATSGDYNSGIRRISADKLAIVTGATDHLTIDSSGLIGIGTTAPGAKLDVSLNTTQSAAKFSNSGIYGSWIDLNATGTNGNNWRIHSTAGSAGEGQGKLVVNIGGGVNAPLTLDGQNAWLGGASYSLPTLAANSSGNVGIGTTAPDAPLHVVNTASPKRSYIKLNPVTTDAYIDMKKYADGNFHGIRMYADTTLNWTIGYTGGAGLSGDELGIKASDGAYKMMFQQDGDVGIGTTDPQNTLHVNGTIRVDTLNSASDIDLCTDTNGVLSDCSSSIRYKDNIADLDMGLDTILAMRPVEFDWQESGLHSFGFVAEEMQAIDDRLVTYKDGQIEGVKYKQLTAVLTNAVQELNAEVISLKAQNAAPLLDLAQSQPESKTQPVVAKDESPTFDPADLIQALIDWLADAANEVIIAAQTTFTNAVTFADQTGFDALARFNKGLQADGPATFNDEVNLSRDQVGQLIIPAGQTEQVVQFEQPFSQAPIVMLTPVGNIAAFLQSSSSTQFTVRLAQAYQTDVVVNWYAFPGHGSGEVTAPDLDQASTDLPTQETPTPTTPPSGGTDQPVTGQPTVTPTPQVTATPTIDPEAVTESQPEPTADQTPTTPESATASAELSE